MHKFGRVEILEELGDARQTQYHRRYLNDLGATCPSRIRVQAAMES